MFCYLLINGSKNGMVHTMSLIVFVVLMLIAMSEIGYRMRDNEDKGA